MKKLLIPLLLVLPLLPSLAQLNVNTMIRSGMVLQRQVGIPLSGEATDGSSVKISLGSTSKEVTATGSIWETELPAMEAGGPYTLTINSGTETLTFTDIWVGDVWLASGQSNMAWKLANTDNATEVIAQSNYQDIRELYVTTRSSSSPQEQLPSGSSWRPATSEYVGDFSAVAYYFARFLHDSLNIPIGIINSSYGGSRIEPWIKEEDLGFNETQIVFGEDALGHHQPNALYNCMIHPLVNTPIRGVIWYQGESNISNRETALEYTTLKKILINSWRNIWGDELPFFWVQLANWGTEANEDAPNSWDAIPIGRSSQSRALSLPFTGEAIAIDKGEVDVHPTDKRTIGLRLSNLARNVAYEEDINCQSPRYKNHQNLGNGVIEVEFDHLADGLFAMDSDDGSLRWFQLAGSDGKFYRAEAELENNRVKVSRSGLSDPRYMRYAWESNPEGVNLYNSDSLPCAPFKVLINDPGFSLSFFKATSRLIDKGASSVLTWEVYRAGRVEIDGIELDTIGGLRVWPTRDSTFTLRYYDSQEPGTYKEETIKILVTQPDPVIGLKVNGGTLIPIGKEITMEASPFVPLGGTVSEVRFYANEEEIDRITAEPYETSWLTDSSGIFDLWARVYSLKGLTTDSRHYQKTAAWLKTDTIEAEDAQRVGEAWLTEHEGSSAGKYVDLARYWEMSFDSIIVPESGEYQLSVSTMLNYGSPKHQFLAINDGEASRLTFESDYEDRWDESYFMVNLDSGINKLTWTPDWGYMRMDYLYVAIPYDPSDTTGITDTTLSILPAFTGAGSLNPEVFPNPAAEELWVRFELKNAGTCHMELLDISGRSTGIISHPVLSPGKHSEKLNLQELPSGYYLLNIRFGNESSWKKVLVR